MYPIMWTHHRLYINNGNKVPVSPGYICNRQVRLDVRYYKTTQDNPFLTHTHTQINKSLKIWFRYKLLSTFWRAGPQWLQSFNQKICAVNHFVKKICAVDKSDFNRLFGEMGYHLLLLWGDVSNIRSLSSPRPMMTSSNGSIFRITGRLCGEPPDRWIPLTKFSDAELRCFLWSVPEKTPVIWDAITSLWRNCNVPCILPGSILSVGPSK